MAAPCNVTSLPEFRPPCQEDAKHDPVDDEPIHGEAAADDSSDGGGDPDADTVPGNDEVPKKDARPAGTPVPVAVNCGRLPNGTRLNDFHLPPATVNRRNAEGIYWTDFSTRASKIFPDNTSDAVEFVNDVSWGVTPDSALKAVDSQNELFQYIDKGGRCE